MIAWMCPKSSASNGSLRPRHTCAWSSFDDCEIALIVEAIYLYIPPQTIFCPLYPEWGSVMRWGAVAQKRQKAGKGGRVTNNSNSSHSQCAECIQLLGGKIHTVQNQFHTKIMRSGSNVAQVSRSQAIKDKKMVKNIIIIETWWLA